MKRCIMRCVAAQPRQALKICAIAVIVVGLPAGAAAAVSERDLHCVALAVYHEARGESFAGQLAVAHVVLNRAASGRFGSTKPCAVVAQRLQFAALRQCAALRAFGARDGREEGCPLIRDRQAWNRSRTVARVALEDRDSDPTMGATYFDQAGAVPPWRHAVVLIVVIGGHAFYREAGR